MVAVIAVAVRIIMPTVALIDYLLATRCNRCRHIPPFRVV